ncbi:SAM-dependent methyltransferase [Streptomyces tibetensis]|uniref:SAM-dependent methyltransferase n=1 Tax=Streptomyces tibetensis TaxID=2382123 RepID=UPI0033CBC631
MTSRVLPLRRPNGLRVLDAFCCSGGMAMGFHLAGFEVVGVDIEPQPDYPFTFHQGDAIDFIARHGADFDLIHGSPPCQAWTPLNAYNHKTYPELIGPARDAMRATGRPYVIENVEAARPELREPIRLCGPTFGLRMFRHRLFETSFPVTEPAHPGHRAICTRNGYLPTPERPFMTITGGRHSKAWQRAAAEAMGTPWITTIRGVCEAIPPAYAHWIATQYLALEGRAAA